MLDDGFTGCSPGVALHPFGSSSFTDVSAAPVVSLRTVTRISRSGVGASDAGTARVDVGAGGVAGLAGVLPRPPAAVACEPRPSVRAAVVGRDGVLRIDDSGTIATSGVTRTENAGTTSRSLRFSPLKMSPSYRC